MPNTANATKKDQQQETQNQGRESLEKALDQKKQQQAQSSNETETQNEQSQQETQETNTQQQQVEKSDESQDADELSKYDNVLKNTYGVTEEELEEGVSPEKARKMAKSWSEMQSTTTKTKQQKQEYEQTVNAINQLMQQDPSLYEHMQAVKNGNSYENPNQQESITEQPADNKGQLDSESVTEDTLVKEGYLDSSELQGLDELARQRKVARAEIQYEKDKTLSEFRNGLKQEQENLQKQQEQKQIKQYNKQKLEEGFDQFVADTGYNLAEVPDEVFNEIKNEAFYDRQGQDPRKIKEDAFPVAAKRVLRRRGMWDSNTQQTQAAKRQTMEDTGVEMNQAQQKQSKLSPSEELKKRAKQNASSGLVDNKAQFFNKK